MPEVCLHDLPERMWIIRDGDLPVPTPVPYGTPRRVQGPLAIQPCASRHTVFAPPKNVNKLESRRLPIDPAGRARAPLVTKI